MTDHLHLVERHALCRNCPFCGSSARAETLSSAPVSLEFSKNLIFFSLEKKKENPPNAASEMRFIKVFDVTG